MPYKIVKVRGGYQVQKKLTGRVVAGKNKPLDYEGAKGYVFHAGQADKSGATK